MPSNIGILNPGIEYQFKVITYTAVCLSENKNVEDYVIYTYKEEVPGFDDIIAKVWYKNKPEPFVYMSQIKYRTSKVNLNSKNSSVEKYKNDIKDIFLKKDTIRFLKKLFENVPEANVEFWFICNNSVQNTIQYPIKVDGIEYNIEADKSYNPIFTYTRNARCYKLTPKFARTDSGDLDKFYLFLNQPDNTKINEHILNWDEKAFTRETTVQIIAYVKEYLRTRVGSQGLKKDDFETQLLRLCLSPVIIPPTQINDIYDDLAHIWNKLIQEFDITIIEQDVTDMTPYLFGTLYKVIKALLNDSEFKWNSCVKNWDKLSGNFDFKKFKELLKREKIFRWVPEPDVLDMLLVEMWKFDFIPLILSSDCNIYVLQKYKHLKKRFIVLDKKHKIYNEVHSTDLKVCVNLSNVQNESLRRQLLEGIRISLQGREPVFANTIGNHKSLLKEIRCSQILTLIKKISKVMVKEEFLEHGISKVFIVGHDPKSKMEVSDNSKLIQQALLHGTLEHENLIINCELSEVDNYLTQIKDFPNSENYSLYHLRREYPSGRLEYLTGNILKIKHFLIDECNVISDVNK